MTYDPKYNTQHYEYRRKKYHAVRLDFERTFYDDTLKPAADESGKTVGRFIKDAVNDILEKNGKIR